MLYCQQICYGKARWIRIFWSGYNLRQGEDAVVEPLKDTRGPCVHPCPGWSVGSGWSGIPPKMSLCFWWEANPHLFLCFGCFTLQTGQRGPLSLRTCLSLSPKVSPTFLLSPAWPRMCYRALKCHIWEAVGTWAYQVSLGILGYPLSTLLGCWLLLITQLIWSYLACILHTWSYYSSSALVFAYSGWP